MSALLRQNWDILAPRGLEDEPMPLTVIIGLCVLAICIGVFLLETCSGPDRPCHG